MTIDIGPGKILLFFYVSLLAITLVPSFASAQESDQTHPYLSDRFQLAVGAFSRNQGFKLSADGSVPEEEIDFDETLGVDDDDVSGALTFRWKFGSKWSLWGQAWKVNARGGAVLTEDVKWEDLVFQQGSNVAAGVHNDVIRVFRTVFPQQVRFGDVAATM